MNLHSFAAEVLRSNQVDKNNASDVKNLLPPLQKDRSYKDIENISASDKALSGVNLVRFNFGENRDEWEYNYNVQWPFNSSDLRKQVTKADMESFAKDWLVARSYYDDTKYVKLKTADDKKVIYVFDAEKWLNDAVSSVKPRWSPPLSLRFQLKKDMPTFVRSDVSSTDLKYFMAKKFRDYLKNNHTLLKHKEFSFLKKITADLFTFDIDYQHREFKATLKYSVVMASLAGYMLYKHKKEFNSSEINNIKRKVTQFGDTKKLDSYIKRI